MFAPPQPHTYVTPPTTAHTTKHHGHAPTRQRAAAAPRALWPGRQGQQRRTQRRRAAHGGRAVVRHGQARRCPEGPRGRDHLPLRAQGLPDGGPQDVSNAAGARAGALQGPQQQALLWRPGRLHRVRPRRVHRAPPSCHVVCAAQHARSGHNVWHACRRKALYHNLHLWRVLTLPFGTSSAYFSVLLSIRSGKVHHR